MILRYAEIHILNVFCIKNCVLLLSYNHNIAIEPKTTQKA